MRLQVLPFVVILFLSLVMWRFAKFQAMAGETRRLLMGDAYTDGRIRHWNSQAFLFLFFMCFSIGMVGAELIGVYFFNTGN